MHKKQQAYSIEQLRDGLRAADRTMLARAITLIESRHPEDRRKSHALLQLLRHDTGKALRLGITGTPGVGKSTCIEALGMLLIEQHNMRVAVLAIDPTSGLTGGSILGDKTRMTRLSVHPQAFVRPSPTGLSPGGVATRTREAILCCEAAGYDVVIIETVGVGQSQWVVSQMTDTLLLLMQADTGDALQGIKRGLREFADIIVVNKADGDKTTASQQLARMFQQLLHLSPDDAETWTPIIETISALEQTGIDKLWSAIDKHRAWLKQDNRLEKKRKRQQLDWMWSMVEDTLLHDLKHHVQLQDILKTTTQAVENKQLDPTAAALRITDAFYQVEKQLPQ